MGEADAGVHLPLPREVSPLARHRPEDPTVTDRFELVIGGRELANGYSELNEPEEQAKRFQAEAAAAAGDAEAHPADPAFVRALEYGLPPTSGIGIGIDRLIMLLAEVYGHPRRHSLPDHAEREQCHDRRR